MANPFRASDFDNSRPPQVPPREPRGDSFSNFATLRRLIALVLIGILVYGIYFWFFRRIVVGPDEVLVLLRKDGGKSLPDDQIVIPRPPKSDSPDYAKWKERYGDCNGIVEQVYQAGVYFGFSPWDYEREVVDIRHPVVPSDKVGIVIKKFGEPLPANQVLADASRNQRGPLPIVLKPGRYPEYANPHAYEVKLIDPIV